MSRHYTKLCSLIVGDIFGDGIQKIVDFLGNKGAVTLTEIVRGTGYPITRIQESLKIMINHCLVVYEVVDEEFSYNLSETGILEMIRYPKYLSHIEKRLGTDAREMFGELLKAGSIASSRLLFICGYRVVNLNANLTAKELLDQLHVFRNTWSRILELKYVELREISKTEEGNNKFAKVIPEIDLKVLVDKLLRKKDFKLEELEDSKILYKVGLTQFRVELRNAMVCQAFGAKFESLVDARVIEILIDSGFERHPWENDGAPCSVYLIKDRLEKFDKGKSIADHVQEHLEVLEEDPSGIVSSLGSAHGSHYTFNMKSAVNYLLSITMGKIIIEKHGFQALRIFQLVKENGFVEQDQINELGMVPGKDAKNLTYKLVEESWMNIKEIRKTYAANAPPGKVYHVFHVDENRAIQSLQEYCYKTMLNLKLRQKYEYDKVRDLTEKEERITRILVNMSGKNCSEDQLNEVREMLTPPERALLHHYRVQSAKLAAGIMQVDETLFLTELYMKYYRHRFQPKVKKSQTSTKNN